MYEIYLNNLMVMYASTRILLHNTRTMAEGHT